jgi:GNAT superfamily N-acetyltransferase
LHDQSYIGWLAVADAGAVIAGAGVHIKPQLPRISHDGSRIVTAPLPLAVNVYSQLEWRGKGIARALMRVLMEWAAAQGTERVVLHASDAGRPLYLSLGFESTNEMRWFPTGQERPSASQPSKQKSSHGRGRKVTLGAGKKANSRRRTR